ncbi:phospholipid carrier-dependent glycosyltransferase [Stakelama saccharophila]|uniref:Polyprenol-phosphate-mannose--protein mannosyltransferase n=1 Tax=Stakelama saccharophila TaxID=3075605 RepID=A0ABZ0BBI5_9SPHN|nr:phospholipid carrier-dependent glycosyltransferase [Stakelama sp. W311]WNO54749.1 phospholipid carrier-dependent glycosyltransferase [Stakelama sp. W311]
MAILGRAGYGPRSMLDRLRRDPLLAALVIGLGAEILFLVHLGWPDRLVFDEIHYVPAARAMLALNRPLNTEHPLLAKEFIAAGIALFGDNPLGWRFFATLAGTATVLAGYWMLWLLFARVRTAAFGALLIAVNQMVYVQARIAMIDIYLGAFVMLAAAGFVWAMEAPPECVKPRLILTGTLLGLATAAKWAAVPYIVFAGIAFLLVRWRDAALAGRPAISALTDGAHPHWRGTGTVPAMLLIGGTSIIVYFLTFAPQFFYAHDPLTLRWLLPFQQAMFDAQTQVLRSHPYQSAWWTWPLVIRPIWYFYEPDGGVWRGVLLIGNPVVMWGGLAAVAACLFAGLRDRAARPLALALFWIASLGIWAIIPKSLGFYYYYHLSGVIICLCLAAAFHHFARGRFAKADEWFAIPAIAVFLYFYPVLSAQPLGGEGAFNHWMLFDSWR